MFQNMPDERYFADDTYGALLYLFTYVDNDKVVYSKFVDRNNKNAPKQKYLSIKFYYVLSTLAAVAGINVEHAAN